MNINEKIVDELIKLRDKKYGEFNSKLIPNVNNNSIIGVRIPQIRALSKQLKSDENIGEFLSSLPHKYFEENCLHAYIIEQIKDYRQSIVEINRFLPYIDNWATCDTLRPKCFVKNKDKLINEIKVWLNSQHVYTVRFAIGMLMVHYLDNDFKTEYLEWVAEIKTDEYYLKMMIAWYFATALAKQPIEAIKYLENNKLDKWIHNKTIQKAIESYRVSNNMKEYLKMLKI